MCTWIWRSSNAVNFLYKVDDPSPNEKLDLDVLAQDEYRQSHFRPPLLPCEELSLFGFLRPPKVDRTSAQHTESASMSFIRKMEIYMKDQYVVESFCQWNTEFPLSRPSHCIGLERELYDSTEDSYRTYRKIPLKSIGEVNVVDLREIEDECHQRRENVEISILRALNRQNQHLLHKLGLISGRIDRATSLDVLQILFDISHIKSFDLGLTSSKIRRLHSEIIDWAVLCVFEDKMRRLIYAKVNKDDTSLVQEFCCIREWQPVSHLRWLAFEVEQQLQIRPNQYEVVRQLQHTPCSLMQLIMGAGKVSIVHPKGKGSILLYKISIIYIST
jgi:hypothetical protein